MDSRTQERVERWDSRTFSGGYEELTTLANNGFSGAVTTGPSWLFMLNGRIVGVVDGTIDDFEHASGTVYAAPAPSLPLLCAMQAQGGSTQANYYTNETSLSEVDSTLQNGSFTGYVELSEQVLSGDYYAVYYGGRRMAAAYIGNSERLLTGDEAFERADDEVGIYEVVDVDIEVTDVPSPNEPEPETENTTEPTTSTTEPTTSTTEPTTSVPEPETAVTENAVSAAGEDDPKLDNGAGEETEPVTETAPTERETDPLAAGPSDGAVDAAAAAPESDSPVNSGSSHSVSPQTDNDTGSASPETGETVEDASDDGVSSPPDDEAEAGVESGPDESTPTEGGAAEDRDETIDVESTTDSGDATVPPESPEKPTSQEASTPQEESGQAASSEDGDQKARFEQEAQWRETRRIPSIDPERSQPPTPDEAPDQSSADTSGQRERSRGQTASAVGEEATADVASQAAGGGEAGGERAAGDRLAALTEQLQQVTDQRDALVAKQEALEDDREKLRAKNRELASTIEQLQGRIESLEGQLEQERARSLDVGSGSGGGEQLSPERALPGTNLFVRYASKSDPTLNAAHEGSAERSEVSSNLQLEHHTEFDADEVTVTGQPFDAFLASTIEYQFVDWLTETLLFEIRDTGHTAGLADLYDVIPRIDRIELHAGISLDEDENEEGPTEVDFDLVAFDKMGTPLVAVMFNESREPATEEMLEEIEEAASAVTAAYPDFGAAISVTTSYFEPGALAVTEEATKRGFLSRSSKQSYVTVSRKQGYHLCLVEARDGGFHLTVPEL
ncbi:transcriptional regulator [Halobacteria archaeon AArc-dxtr1]|nr:transcriptional regulator [Halobacteria archaeon AArc-dxtr1]